MSDEMKFQLEVIEVDDRGLPINRACRAAHRKGQRWSFDWHTPSGLCGEVYAGLYPLLVALRVGGDMRELGSTEPNRRVYTCPSRVVRFRLSAFSGVD